VHPQLELVRAELNSAIDSLSAADAERAVEGRWSIANVLEHLDLTFSRNAAGLERRIAKGDAPARRRTLKQAAIRFLIVTLGYFPEGRKSPEMVVPKGRPYSDVVKDIQSHLEELDRVMAEGERALGATGAVLDHPVIGPFSIDDWRTFHVVHTRHHVKHIKARRIGA